nr:hypothetical protein BC332_14364 [Ipomoea batatas]
MREDLISIPSFMVWKLKWCELKTSITFAKKRVSTRKYPCEGLLLSPEAKLIKLLMSRGPTYMTPNRTIARNPVKLLSNTSAIFSARNSGGSQGTSSAVNGDLYPLHSTGFIQFQTALDSKEAVNNNNCNMSHSLTANTRSVNRKTRSTEEHKTLWGHGERRMNLNHLIATEKKDEFSEDGRVGTEHSKDVSHGTLVADMIAGQLQV